jgi:hypothetical protein
MTEHESVCQHCSYAVIWDLQRRLWVVADDDRSPACFLAPNSFLHEVLRTVPATDDLEAVTTWLDQ